jgi:hypothetical protein
MAHPIAFLKMYDTVSYTSNEILRVFDDVKGGNT